MLKENNLRMNARTLNNDPGWQGDGEKNYAPDNQGDFLLW